MYEKSEEIATRTTSLHFDDERMEEWRNVESA